MSDGLGGRPSRVPHVLFGGVVGLLAVLAAWWFWVMAHAVATEDALWRKSMEAEARLIESEIVSEGWVDLRKAGPEIVGDSAQFTITGIIAGDPRPRHVVVSPETQKAHAADMHRKRVMVYGEGSFLVLLVLGCVVMLYRLVLAEQRWRRDTDLFLGRVTHEMKTPLAGLKAMLQTLRDGRVPPERLAEIAELGLRQAEREEHLIENLLTAHRLATRAAALECSDVDLADILREFVEHRRRTMRGGDETIDLAVPDSLPVRANAGAVHTILENLADNAFKYGAHRFALAARPDAASVVLTAEDDGEGFDPARAEDLFRPFRRGEDARAAGRHGTGLGLPISRALAEEMRGTLTARANTSGRGSTFELRLPGRPAAR